MRAKIQAKNSAGLLQDIVVDPGNRHLLALYFTPRDLEYLAKHKVDGSRRVHLGGVPIRVKTRVGGPNGGHVDIVADRTVGDWIALELTADDILRLTTMGVGQSTAKIVYAGPKGHTHIQVRDIEKFKADWPEFGRPDENVDYEKGMAKSIAKNDAEATMYRQWMYSWPLQFHSTEKVKAPKLVLADGRQIDGKDG